MTCSVELRCALLIQLLEHLRVLQLFMQKPVKTFREFAWQRTSQQGCQYGSSDGGFEKDDLLAKVDGLELVVAKALLFGEHSVGWRVIQRREFLWNEALPVIHSGAFN
jgi:hypothetical protein